MDNGKKGVDMKARSVLFRLLAILAVPALVVSLIDALEGGLMLLVVGVIYLVAFGVFRSRPPRSLWVPYVSAIGIAILTLVIAFLTRATDPGPTGFSIFAALGNWLYRGAVLVTLVGAVRLLIRASRYDGSASTGTQPTHP